MKISKSLCITIKNPGWVWPWIGTERVTIQWHSQETNTQQQPPTCARLRPDAINSRYLSNYSLSFLPIFVNGAQTAGTANFSSWLPSQLLATITLSGKSEYTVIFQLMQIWYVLFSPLLLTQTSNLITVLLLSCLVIIHFIVPWY